MDFYNDVFKNNEEMIKIAGHLQEMLPEDSEIMTIDSYNKLPTVKFAMRTEATNRFPIGTKGDAVLSLAYIEEKSAEMTPGAVVFCLNKLAERAVVEGWLDVYDEASGHLTRIKQAWKEDVLNEKTAEYKETTADLSDTMFAYVDGDVRKYSLLSAEHTKEAALTFVSDYTLMPEEKRASAAKAILEASDIFGIDVPADSTLRKVSSSKDHSMYFGDVLEPIEMKSEIYLETKQASLISMQNWSEMNVPILEKRAYAKEIVKAAAHFNIEVPDTIKLFASDELNPSIKLALYSRMRYINDETSLDTIREMAKRASADLLDVDTLVGMVDQMDKIAGLNHHWGTSIQDPIRTVLAMPTPTKTAEDLNPVQESDAMVEFEGQQISIDAIKNGISENPEESEKFLNESVIQGLSGDDAVDTFNQLPLPHKQFLVSLATESQMGALPADQNLAAETPESVLDPKTAAVKCECLNCGNVVDSEDHCKDMRCPRCGGDMRRLDRPGKQAAKKEESKGVEVEPVGGDDKKDDEPEEVKNKGDEVTDELDEDVDAEVSIEKVIEDSTTEGPVEDKPAPDYKSKIRDYLLHNENVNDGKFRSFCDAIGCSEDEGKTYVYSLAKGNSSK